MLYDYQCSECNTIFTLKLSLAQRKEPTDEPCPRCNKLTVRQIITTCPPTITDKPKLNSAFEKNVINRIADTVPGNRIEKRIREF